MTLDPTFWVAISFFIFFFGLIYLKVPQKINNSLNEQINKIKNEINESEQIKMKAKDLLADYEKKIEKSKKETQEIINFAKKKSEQMIIEKTKKFHEITENKKKEAERKILQMKKNALSDIKNISVKISIKTVEHLIKNSIDNNKLEKFDIESLKQVKNAIKQIKT